MLSFACLLALAAAASAAYIDPLLPPVGGNPLWSNRIVGGQDYDISQVPYQISLQISGSHICGGSILTSRFVMTASHCIIGMEPNWPYYNIRVGSSNKNSGGQVIAVRSFHSHPEYNPNAYWTNDIAVLELADDIVMSNNAQPVGLPNLGTPLPINQYATVSGWGNLQEGGSSPSQLQGVVIPINDPSVCEQAYGSSSFNRNTMVCAASTVGGESTCQGDSGGPLVYKGNQWGIVSWAAGCARPNYPTVFAHVSNLRQFVTDVVGI